MPFADVSLHDGRQLAHHAMQRIPVGVRWSVLGFGRKRDYGHDDAFEAPDVLVHA